MIRVMIYSLKKRRMADLIRVSCLLRGGGGDADDYDGYAGDDVDVVGV